MRAARQTTEFLNVRFIALECRTQSEITSRIARRDLLDIPAVLNSTRKTEHPARPDWHDLIFIVWISGHPP